MLSSARRVPRLAAPVARAFSQSGAPKRPRAVRVKKSEARRSVPEPERPPRHALAEVPPPPQAPAPFLPQEQQQAPQTFGGVMKESFLWGVGMALAFSFIGVVFSSMEETVEPGRFDASGVTAEAEETEGARREQASGASVEN